MLLARSAAAQEEEGTTSDTQVELLEILCVFKEKNYFVETYSIIWTSSTYKRIFESGSIYIFSKYLK